VVPFPGAGQWDFSAIGKEDRVDRRTVAKRVREYERRDMMNLDEIARRDLAVKRLNEHFEDLELAALSLCGRTVSPTRTGSLRPYEDDHSPRFRDLFAALRHELKQVFLTRWGYGFRVPRDNRPWELQDPAPEPYDSMACKEADNLVTGLREHFPQVSPLLDDWNRIARSYREKWLRLENEMVGQGYAEPQATQALEDILRAATENRMDSFGGEVVQKRPKGGKPVDAYQYLYQLESARERVDEMAGYLRDLESTSTHVEEIIGPGQIRNGLLRTRCRYCTVT
jgi:hypothetical protein